MSQIRNIVAAVDFSEHSSATVARARSLAEAFSASLHLVHGVHPQSFAMSHDFSAFPGSWEAAREEASNQMGELRNELESSGMNVTTRVSELDPVHAVLASADDHQADVIVMGTHGSTGLAHAIMGSVAEGVLRRARCPVLTVKEGDVRAASPIHRVAVATDLGGNSEPAVAWAFGLAHQIGCAIELVHAFSFQADAFPHTEAWEKEIEEKARVVTESVEDQCRQHRRPETVAKVQILRGDAPALLISRYAKDQDVDLVVLGTHGYTGIRHAILGSVAEETLHRSPCSVVTIKANSS